MRWTPAQLAAITSGRVLADTGEPIAGAFLDSRNPVVGGLFVPIVAARDGHAFLDAAIEAGAAAVLTGPNRPRPRAGASVIEVACPEVAFATLARDARARCTGPVVGITGSNGKTTTRSMIAAVLATGFGDVLCTRGNYNNHLGVPLTLLSPPHRADAMVLEFGMSAAGENRALAELARPTISVITSIALEHLEFMGSLEAIAAAEAEVISTLPPGGIVVAPADEPMLRPHLVRAPKHVEKVMFSDAGTNAQVQVRTVEVGASTLARLGYQTATHRGEIDVHLQLFGAHNARNAAAALAVGLGLGLDVQAMADALSQVQPVGDRSRVMQLGPHHVIADCYNANPGSCEAALTSLAEVNVATPGRRVAVLGDMLELGPEELQLHEMIGRRAGELGIDVVFGVGPRSRSLVAAARASGAEAHHLGDALASTPEGLTSAAAQVYKTLGSSGGWLLIKGSRGIRLERLLDPLNTL